MNAPILRRRVEGYAIACWVAGLAWWYLGGSSAIARLYDETPAILAGVGFGCVVAAALAVALRGEGFKRAAGEGVFAGAGTALVLVCAVPWFNQHLDGSAGQEVGFTVEAVRQPTKGPRSLDVSLEGRVVNLPYADGCAKGASGVVTRRAGAFGMAWTSTPRCTPAGR